MTNTSSLSKTNAAGVKYISAFLISISLVLGISIGIVGTTLVNKVSSNPAKNSISSESFFDVQYVNQIFSRFQSEYIGDLPDQNALTHGVVKGIISSLNDPYTYFLNPEEAKDYLASRSPDFEGIGVTLRFSNNNTEVETVLSGYPAERTGIKTGDIIVKVDEEEVEGQTPNVVASKIRGEKGTKVKLELYRPSSAAFLNLEVIREKIEISNVSYRDLGDGVYKIDISQFVDESVEAFNRSWDEIVEEITVKNNVKSLIIDLRNNPGGYVNAVRHVLEEFLEENKVIMYEETKSIGRLEYRDYRDGKFENVPLVVIVNEGSASASEIFAGAIQENSRGKVIGMPTVGKGVEQQMIADFPDQSILVMVFQKWLTPNGRNVTKENPIIPDHKVEYTQEDFNAGIDTQLEKALEILR